METIGTIGEATVPRPREQTATFDQLVALHEPRVRRLAYRLLGWRDAEIDDVVQDVFLSALRNLDRFRGDSKVATWLAAVTINRCRTHRRRQLLRRLRWFNASRPEADYRPPGDDTCEAVRSAVQSLSPRDREVIVLCYLEELPIAQIAELLRVSRAVVDTRLSRARQKLKEKLSTFMTD